MEENQKGRIETGHTVVSFRVENPVPPPPGFISPFKTLQEWLFHLCDSNQQPDEAVSEYIFVLSDSPGNVDIYFVGYAYTIDQGISTRRTGYTPTNWFFPLPKAEYGHLVRQQLREKVMYELKEFTKTDVFQHSFLSKGCPIMTNFGDEIWL